MRNAPEMMEVDDAHLQAVLRRVEQALDDQDSAFIRAVFESYAYVTDLVEDKNTTIRRLRQLFFGARTEKTRTVVGGTVDPPPNAPSNGVTTDPQTANGQVADPGDAATAAAGKGHGRNGVEAYQGAERIDVRHPTLSAGDPCPACRQGTVYEKTPGVLVRITGQPPLAAKIYQLQKLRCHLCGQVFTAATPAAVGSQKYDATAGSMIGLLKYGSGLPFNRLEGLQGHLEIPLPASTQWDIVQAVALAYGTYLGGFNDDKGHRLAVDAAGNAYVTGVTHSTDFPTTPGAFDTTFNGSGTDAFMTKLSGDGSTLAYGTYLGGSDFDVGHGIAVDGAGNAYLTGDTYSTNFPTTPGAFDTTHNGNFDAFVTKFCTRCKAPLQAKPVVP